MHPLYGALFLQHVPLRVTRGVLVVHQYTYRLLVAEPRMQVPEDLYALAVSLLNDLSGPVFDGVGLAGFKNSANAFYWPELLAPLLSSTVFPFCSFIL